MEVGSGSDVVGGIVVRGGMVVVAIVGGGIVVRGGIVVSGCGIAVLNGAIVFEVSALSLSCLAPCSSAEALIVIAEGSGGNALRAVRCERITLASPNLWKSLTSFCCMYTPSILRLCRNSTRKHEGITLTLTRKHEIPLSCNISSYRGKSADHKISSRRFNKSMSRPGPSCAFQDAA